MFAVKLNLTEWKKEIRDLQKVNYTNLNKRVAKILIGELKKQAPVDTGEYRKSWKIKKVTKNLITLETPQGFLFDILEFQGSKPHIIRPRRASVLHWIDKQTGEHRFAMEVNHPGFEPIPHARPTLKKVVKIYRDMIIQELQKKDWIN